MQDYLTSAPYRTPILDKAKMQALATNVYTREEDKNSICRRQRRTEKGSSRTAS